MLMHEYGGGGGGWPYDDKSKKNFSQSEIFAVYLCHNNSFYLFSWFSTRYINCCFIIAYMFFISGVSLICIDVNNF